MSTTKCNWWNVIRNCKIRFKKNHFQAFKVEHEACMDLRIVVNYGENISKGNFYKDVYDTPDPYVMLKVPEVSKSFKRTSHIDNTTSPIWNETFCFHLHSKMRHTLSITLMDANQFIDEVIGENFIDVNSLPENQPKDFIAEYPGGSMIHLTVTYERNQKTDLRFSNELCQEEKNFWKLRRENVMKTMQHILEEKGPKRKAEVPVIAILGSGGGFRAMIALSGAMKVLREKQILACSMYLAGVSGSSWLISTVYAHDKFPTVTFEEIYDELLHSTTQNWKWNLIHCHRYILDMFQKWWRGQSISFVDYFGHLLGDVLLRGKKHKKLSDQRAIVDGGNVPFPLYTCLHAKDDVSCLSFSEWIEFSPYEIGMAKYGTFMRTEHFGSKFIAGKLIRKYPEFSLSFLQGIWGSAFTILMKRLAAGKSVDEDICDGREERRYNNTRCTTYIFRFISCQLQSYISQFLNWIVQWNILQNHRFFRAGKIHNPFRALPICPQNNGHDETDGRFKRKRMSNKEKKLNIVDSGLAFNSPFPILLRPQRKVDIYLSFDFSERPSDSHMPFDQLIIAEKWAKEHRVPFPPITKMADEFSKEPIKEFYVFKNEENLRCPVIIHFVIVNNKFKDEKEPGVQRETSEEKMFADFSLFDDATKPYSSLKFIYEPIQYKRLVKLMEYNTLLAIDTVKEEIALKIEKKRKLQEAFVCGEFDKISKKAKHFNLWQKKQSIAEKPEIYYDAKESLQEFDVAENFEDRN